MPLSHRFKPLLDNCLEMELGHLKPLLDNLFENADVALLEFAGKAQNNMAQSLFFDAMNEVHKKRRRMEQKFYSEVRRSFHAFPLTSSLQGTGSDSGPAGLSLIDTADMEESIAIQNAVKRLRTRLGDRVFALKQRLSVLNEGRAIEENQIPGGPLWLGAAFRPAVDELELEVKVRVVIIALFDKHVLHHTDLLFEEYNERLIQAGILPHLRYEIRKQEDIAPASGNASPRSARDPALSDNEDELFGSICELLSGNEAPHTPATQNTPAGATATAGRRKNTPLITQIDTLQTQVQSSTVAVSRNEFIENIEVDRNLVERLQQTLKREREKLFGQVDRYSLPAADTHVIELVGMLFEYMLKEENLPNVVKALLSRLHTPMLKVAILDRHFFTRAQHSARKLLNDMTSAGIRWVDENQIERGIFPTMKDVVDRVLTEFKEDVHIFEELVDEFSKRVDELKHRAQVVEQRTNEAANGQEKLQSARLRAQQEIRTLTRGKPLPIAVSEFLELIWADRLTLILLRNARGKESEDWISAVAVAQAVVASGQVPDSDQEREARLQLLPQLQEKISGAARALQQPDMEKRLTALFACQKQVLDKPNLADQKILHSVRERDSGGASQAGQEKENTQPSTKLETMNAKLRSIPFGTWFDFHESGKPALRAKLSWRSSVTRKFMFVDQLGVKAAVIDIQDLSERILDGSVRIVPTDKKPFVDRAMKAIHGMLEHATKAAARA